MDHRRIVCALSAESPRSLRLRQFSRLCDKRLPRKSWISATSTSGDKSVPPPYTLAGGCCAEKDYTGAVRLCSWEGGNCSSSL